MIHEPIYGAVALASYLAGSIPFGLLIAKAVRGVDIREQGSGNIGATNVARVLGWPWFFPVFALDFLKGFAPVFWLAPATARYFPCPHCPALLPMLTILCGAAAMAGHLGSIFLRGQGGKGVATTAGVFFALAPPAAAAALGVWAVVFALFRYISLASIVAAASLPAAAWFLIRTSDRTPIALFCAVAAAAVIVRHRSNIGRLLRGEEPRVRKNPGA